MASPIPSQFQSLREGIKSLHLNSDYSDLVIEHESRYWRVHKAIVCSQSSFFKKACKDGWQESKNNTIKLPDESEAVIDQLLTFLYTSTYEDMQSTTPESPHGPMQFNIKMFIAADKFDMTGLSELARSNFLSRLDAFADKQDFIRAVYELYQEAPATGTKDMREKVVMTGTRNAHQLFAAAVGKEKKKTKANKASVSFHSLIRDVPEFGDQVTMGLSAAFEETKRNSVGTSTHWCDACPSQFTITRGRNDTAVKCPYCQGSARKLW